jgi:hypothetical protein
MATCAKFTRLTHYLRKFVEASHIFLKNGHWRVSASLASPRNTARQVLVSLASPRNTARRMSVSPRNAARRMSARNSHSQNSLSSGHCVNIIHFLRYTVKPVLTATSEQQAPANIGQSPPSRIKFNNNFD